jgi:tetratricopeptide (TPR) repeat protein
MPYLQRLQKEFKNDLTIISISTESAATVKNFIARKKNTNYAVAVDDRFKTYSAYMGGRKNIPMAFIINKNGTIAWIGHPMDMYLPVKRIITGKFNIQKNARRQKVFREIRTLLAKKNYTPALKIVNKELANDSSNIQFIALKSFILFNTGKKDEAVKFIGSMLKQHPCSLELFDLKSYMLNQLKRYKEMDAFALEFAQNCKERPLLLNQFARKMLGTRFAEARLEPALKAAELAYSNRKLYKLQRADIGETLARIYYMVGRIDRAIKIQKVVCRILKENKKPRYAYALKILSYYTQAYKLGQGAAIKLK